MIDYLPFLLGGFGLVVLLLVGWVWWANEKLKHQLVQRAVELLDTSSTREEAFVRLMAERVQPAEAEAFMQLALQQRHRHIAKTLLDEGKDEDETMAALTDQGISEEPAQSMVAWAQLARFREKHPVASITLSLILPLFGVVVMLCGFALWLGNKTERFATFPYAGHLVLGIGFMITALGVAFWRKR